MSSLPPSRNSGKDFGKRLPPSLLPPRPQPAKRSGHVALLVMGTLAVGTTAYTLMPRQRCEQSQTATTDPAQPSTTCSGSSGGHGISHSVRSRFFGGDSASHSSSSSVPHGVARGGFGSFGHGFSGGG